MSLNRPSNVFEIGSILFRAAKVCRAAGATPILVHHANKNSDAKDAVLTLDSLAFAGIGEFARQWILLGRHTPFVPGSGRHQLVMNVGGSAGHSGTWQVDIREDCVERDFGGRTWRVKVAEHEFEAKEKASKSAIVRPKAIPR